MWPPFAVTSRPASFPSAIYCLVADLGSITYQEVIK